MDIPIEFLIRAGQAETAEALREHAVRKLAFVLRPFQAHVRRITLRLVDVNGPRRGGDSRCSIAVDLTSGPQLFVDATEAWPLAAITRAASRLGEAIRRVHRRQARTPRRSRGTGGVN